MSGEPTPSADVLRGALEAYFAEGASWDADRQAQRQRSERTAWQRTRQPLLKPAEKILKFGRLHTTSAAATRSASPRTAGSLAVAAAGLRIPRHVVIQKVSPGFPSPFVGFPRRSGYMFISPRAQRNSQL